MRHFFSIHSRLSCRTPKSRRGLTYTESLVSLLILSFILAVGVNIYFNADEIMGLAIHKKMAAEYANTKMELLKDGGYLNLPSPNASPTPEQISVGGLTATQYVYVQDVDDIPQDGVIDYRQVTVTVDWSEANSTMSRNLQLITLIAP